MTIPPRDIDSAHPPGWAGDDSGLVKTIPPVSKREGPAWASEEWVTATVPVYTEPTAIEAGQEQDLVAALVSALDGDPLRIQRVVDALTELLTKDR
ncbi:MAG: hypothetical protein ABIP39_10970 [Polyangiaceae bacterium]